MGIYALCFKGLIKNIEQGIFYDFKQMEKMDITFN